MNTFLVEIADDYHPAPYRIHVEWDGDLPREIGTFGIDFDDTGKGYPYATGFCVRTGTAPDGVPVYAWIPNG